MLKYNKTVFYYKHVFNMATNNKIRLVLSILGLLVGLFIFSLGNIILDSYYTSKLAAIEDMDKASVVLLKTTKDKQTNDELRKISNEAPTEVIASGSKSLIFYNNYNESNYYSLSASVVGVSKMEKIVPAFYNDSFKIAANYKLLKGRVINANDVALESKVVVIDKFTESMLFPKGDSIGNQLKLNIKQSNIADVSLEEDHSEKEEQIYTVIGVIDNLNNSKSEEMKYKKGISTGNNNILLNTTIYFPISVVEKMESINELHTFIWTSLDVSRSKLLENRINTYCELNRSNFNYYSVNTYDIMRADMEKELGPLKVFINIILLLLLLISGITIMSVMFFSVKERIHEIGIKKVCGATKTDILTQFILEGIFISLIGATIAVFLSCIVALIIQGYIQNSLFMIFHVNINLSNIITPFFISVIYGFTFCLIPSLYGAKILVTSALRFE